MAIIKLIMLSPVIIGPVTLAKLVQFMSSTVSADLQRMALLNDLIPVYRSLIKDLAKIGVKEVQFHEPALTYDDTAMNALWNQVYPDVFLKDVSVVSPGPWMLIPESIQSQETFHLIESIPNHEHQNTKHPNSNLDQSL
jgi:methionine synthase II (cobalamin-independent)